MTAPFSVCSVRYRNSSLIHSLKQKTFLKRRRSPCRFFLAPKIVSNFCCLDPYSQPTKLAGAMPRVVVEMQKPVALFEKLIISQLTFFKPRLMSNSRLTNISQSQAGSFTRPPKISGALQVVEGTSWESGQMVGRQVEAL